LDKKFIKYSEDWFVDLYMKHGSVEEAMKASRYGLPISVAGFHRIVTKKGMIKSPGRHMSFPEALHFFKEKALTPGTPLEKLYRKMPPSFKTSMVTLHRIYRYIESGKIRRHATALIIHNQSRPQEILVGDEVSGNSRYGRKVGDSSVLMSFSKEGESCNDSVLRVLQQEFSISLAISGELENLVPKNISPLMYLDILDVRVQVFNLELPSSLDSLESCSSYKIKNHRFENIYDIAPDLLRLGVKEIIDGYKLYVSAKPEDAREPRIVVSELNTNLLALAYPKERVPNQI